MLAEVVVGTTAATLDELFTATKVFVGLAEEATALTGVLAELATGTVTFNVVDVGLAEAEEVCLVATGAEEEALGVVAAARLYRLARLRQKSRIIQMSKSVTTIEEPANMMKFVMPVGVQS